MSRNTQEVVYEGWLTKSPPTKRIWRARWRRRWFTLRHSGELPGQFILTYYTDKHCRKLKGVINLDHCEQVDRGLKLEERKLKFDHVFDIKTPTRTYYLAADTEKEMISWVKCICNVCGLKCTSGDEDPPISLHDVEIVEEIEEAPETAQIKNESPPVSPVSPSPYIPISECFSGRSPIVEQSFHSLLDHNLKNSYFRNYSSGSQDLSQRTYLNCTEEFRPQFYDMPRKLTPQASQLSKGNGEEDAADKDLKYSPLQSPTDSESVFTDDDWNHNTSGELNTSRTTRPSDSSADVDITVTQKFTKMTVAEGVQPVAPPPRPPKPAHIASTPIYCNSSSVQKSKEGTEKHSESKLLSDDMYDIPRSHQLETESARNTLVRRHNYNNAEPVVVDGQIFRYDVSPKPGTSSTVFKYDIEDTQAEPASPLSQGSTHATYLNCPSPGLADGQDILKPPPVINRDLKPKRKLSDSHSITSNPEPPSPRPVPPTDRKMKLLTTPLQGGSLRKPTKSEEEKPIRAAPSPTPLGRSQDSLLDCGDQEQIYHFLPGCKTMQYLDLDLELGSSQFSPTDSNSLPLKTVYKEVDFTKTLAFNITRNNLEKERNEGGTMSFKK